MPRYVLPYGAPPSRKIAWSGILVGVQPRIRMVRSYDEHSHSYLGYVLIIDGRIDNDERRFIVAIGAAAHAKHQFRVGDSVAGLGVEVADPQLEVAELYKVSGLKLVSRAHDVQPNVAPPWQTVAITLEAYRARGHRRLEAASYDAHCTSCVWGCRMVVEIVKDNWKGIVTSVREETFCYGPKSCARYKAGPKRRAPGRGDAVYVEDDDIDEMATAHRGDDD
jgi:hypothetical protein